MSKIVSAAASAAVGFVLTAAGYSGAGTATAGAVSQLNFLFLDVPFITMGLALLTMLFFRLDEKDCDRYWGEIAARNNNLEAQSIS